MAGRLPLEASDLLEIEGCLNEGRLDDAQRLLARAGENPAHELGVSYLAARLLHLRGKLDAEGVRVRLGDLLQRSGPFPQAEALLVKMQAAAGATTSTGHALPAAPPEPKGSSGPSKPVPPPRVGPRSGSPADATPLAMTSVRPATDTAPIVADAPTQAAMPRSEETPEAALRPLPEVTPEAEVRSASRRPLLPLTPPADVEIPNPPKLPAEKPAKPGRPPPRMRSSAVQPVWQSTPAPGRSSFPSTHSTSRPSLLPDDPDSSASWRARAYGLEPAVSTSPPPKGRRSSSLPRGAGRYQFVGEDIDSQPASRRFQREEVVTLGRTGVSTTPVDKAAFPASQDSARREFDHQAWQALGALDDPRDPHKLAQAAVQVLSFNSATHWFAPFDSSLFALYRFELALNALRGGAGAQLGQASLNLLGAYLGETLRHCQRGEWTLARDSLDSEVNAGAFGCKPYRVVNDHLVTGANPSLMDRLSAGLAAEGTRPWLTHRASVTPRGLWRNSPAAEDFPRIVATLPASPLSRACALPLNASWESLAALEPVAERITRCAAPLRGSEPWLVRLCMLLGAYVGEVVRRRAGGSWHTAAGGPSAEAYQLTLASGFQAEPVAAMRERIKNQNGVRLVGYANALLRK